MYRHRVCFVLFILFYFIFSSVLLPLQKELIREEWRDGEGSINICYMYQTMRLSNYGSRNKFDTPEKITQKEKKKKIDKI